jgi:hypothetical protein
MNRTNDHSLALILYGAVLAALAGLVLLLVVKGKKVSRPSILDGFFLLALIPLASPLGWDYTFLSSAPAVMLICRHYDKFRRFWKGLFLTSSSSPFLYDIRDETLCRFHVGLDHYDRLPVAPQFPGLCPIDYA